jgi:signal transduction histidine kinase
MLHIQGCNPSATDGSIAPEVLILAATVVVVFQMLARGVSRPGLLVAWVVMIVAINTSLWLVGSISYMWINGELACLMALSYELERLPLRQFIKSVRMLEASEINAHLRVAVVKYQVREGEMALEAKRSMVRHIGHEIRTPLNIIGVGTDVLSKELKRLGPVVPSVVLEVVEGMKEASGTALEVVNELLMFEKLAAGMTTIETVPTRIVRFIDKAMKQHLIPARAKEIDFKLTVEARDRDMGVDIDPVKMTIVFRNLFR